MTNEEAGKLAVERHDLREYIKTLENALRACQYELVTLSPRLTPTYRKSVEQCVKMAKDALDRMALGKGISERHWSDDMSRYDFTVLMPSRLSDVFEEVRRVSSKDVPEFLRNSRDPHQLGPGWYHLTALHDLPGIEPSGHVNGHWETNYCKPRTEVLDAMAQHILMPPTGFEVVRWFSDGTIRLIASGAGHIGGCTVCIVVCIIEEETA